MMLETLMFMKSNNIDHTSKKSIGDQCAPTTVHHLLTEILEI